MGRAVIAKLCILSGHKSSGRKFSTHEARRFPHNLINLLEMIDLVLGVNA